MAFDDIAPPTEPGRRLSIVACGEGWAVKHGEGFLGLAANRDEALRLMRALLEEPARPVSRRRR